MKIVICVHRLTMEEKISDITYFFIF